MKDRFNLPLNYREKSNSRISLIASIITLAVLVLIFNRLDYNMVRKPAREAAQAAADKKEAEEKAATTVRTDTVDFLAAGDNIMYARIYESGVYNGTWNYDHIYENIASTIKAADVSLVCQETTFTGSHDTVSGYPNYATPTEVGDALVKAGFDVIAHASDHANDYGKENIKQTLDFWKTNYPDLTVVGIHDAEETEKFKTITVNDVTIALLNYTFGSYNSIEEYGTKDMINVMDRQKISAMIETVKGYSDCIVFIAHWGNDQETMPSEYEKQWANYLLSQGVHVLIGSHPHVLQPYGRMTDNAGHEMVVFYSLGSFVSSLQSIDELLGGLARFTIERTIKEGKATIKILDPYIEPIVMHYEYSSNTYSPYLLSKYTDDLASMHSVTDYIGDYFTVTNLEDRFDELMSKSVEPSIGTDLIGEDAPADTTSEENSIEGDGDSDEEGGYENEGYENSDESSEDEQ